MSILIGEDGTVSRKAIEYSLGEFEIAFGDFRSKLEEDDKFSFASVKQKPYHEWLSRCDPLVFHKSSESLIKWSDSGKLLDMFLSLKMRKWYVYGEWNEGSPVMKLLKPKRVPLVAVPNSSHFMMIDNLEEFNRTLLRLHIHLKTDSLARPMRIHDFLTSSGIDFIIPSTFPVQIEIVRKIESE